MKVVETVTGSLDVNELGPTLMHEHVFMLDHEVQANYPGEWADEETMVADAVAKLDALAETGIRTIVDLTVCGLGRYLPRVQLVAARTSVRIVAATGFYCLKELPIYFQFRGPGKMFGGPEPLIEMFVTDITEGIAGTGVRAGVLKCATDEDGVTPDVERVLRAVAEAHRLTGVPISTHTHAATHRGLDQQRVLAEEGVDLSRVVIGHSGDTTDIGYLEKLLENGSYLGMDRFGIDSILAFEDRVATVARMCDLGHASRMVLSHDACCWSDNAPIEGVRRVIPNWHYLHLSNDVIPALRERGVTDEQLHQMLVDNPRAIFAAGTE